MDENAADCKTVGTPADPSELPPPSYVHVDAHSTDELAEALGGWHLKFLQLERGAFRGEMTTLHFDRVIVARGSMSQPLLQRYTTPLHCVTLSRPARESSPLLWRGRVLGDGECLVGGPGESGDTVFRGAHAEIALSIHSEVWQSEAHWLGPSPLSSARGVTVHAPGRDWVTHCLSSVDWLIGAVTNCPAVMQSAELRRSLEEWLLARINNFSVSDVSLTDRGARAHRLSAVQRAQAYIHENLTEPLRLSDLCRHAHLQARSLEYGFHDVLGITPMAYVKMLRLNRVRDLLRSPQQPGPLGVRDRTRLRLRASQSICSRLQAVLQRKPLRDPPSHARALTEGQAAAQSAAKRPSEHVIDRPGQVPRRSAARSLHD